MSINFEQGRIGLPIGTPLKYKRFLEDEGIPPARLPNHESCVKDHNDKLEVEAVPKDLVESKTGSETENDNQNLGLMTREKRNSLLAQKIAVLEGGIISSNSFFRAPNKNENVTHSTKTEKTKNTWNNPGSGNGVEKHSSSLEMLSKSNSQEENFDLSNAKTNASFRSFAEKDTLLEPEVLSVCHGATAENSSEDSDSHNMTGNMFTHGSFESFASKSETNEAILSATLVEVQVEYEANRSRSPTSLPEVEATNMVDTKSWRRRLFLLFGCCLLLFILVGALSIFMF